MHRTLFLVLCALFLASCQEPVAPEKPPYLAILSRFTVTPEAIRTSGVRYVVEELSGTLGINRSLVAAAGDTVVLSLPPASYVVEMLGLPTTCSVREGPKRLITLLEEDNTGLLRYNVACVPSLSIVIDIDGYEIDTEMAYRVSGTAGAQVGLVNLAGPDSMLTRSDTIVLEQLPAGEYTVELSHVAANCSLYGEEISSERTIALAGTGGAVVHFRVRCSDPAQQPRILSMTSSYHDGASAFVMRVVDPDRDTRAYRWDITDCRGKSVLPDGSRLRRGLDGGRTFRADTMVILGGFEVGIAESDLQGRCTAMMVEDFNGNTSAIVQQPILSKGLASAPVATDFNARLVGTTSIATELAASDPDGDFAGVFVAVRLRDGVLAPFDGQPDMGILDPAGFLDTVIPAIPLGTKLRWDDVYAVIVYLIDHAGNFRRLEDGDLFR